MVGKCSWHFRKGAEVDSVIGSFSTGMCVSWGSTRYNKSMLRVVYSSSTISYCVHTEISHMVVSRARGLKMTYCPEFVHTCEVWLYVQHWSPWSPCIPPQTMGVPSPWKKIALTKWPNLKKKLFMLTHICPHSTINCDWEAVWDWAPILLAGIHFDFFYVIGLRKTTNDHENGRFRICQITLW